MKKFALLIIAIFYMVLYCEEHYKGTTSIGYDIILGCTVDTIKYAPIYKVGQIWKWKSDENNPFEKPVKYTREITEIKNGYARYIVNDSYYDSCKLPFPCWENWEIIKNQ